MSKKFAIVIMALIVVIVSIFIGRQLALVLPTQNFLAGLPGLGGRGDHVATLEVEVPQSSEFTLRGTIPVPKGRYSFINDRAPFGVEDSNGRMVDTQVEPVAYYPDNSPSVVEILARVKKPGGAGAGQRVEYRIFEDEHRELVHSGQLIDVPHIIKNSNLEIPESIRNLAENGRLIVRTEDVFGNKYTLDVLRPENRGIEILRYGSEAIQIGTYDVLKPLPGAPKGPPTGALDHMHGVHAYLTFWKDEPVISLDLMISNASINGDPNDPDDNAMADLYFKNLELVIYDNDFILEADPKDRYFGDPYQEGDKVVYPFVKNESNGKMHVMKSQGAHTIRYFTLSPAANTADAKRIVKDTGLGFAVPGRSQTNQNLELFSWQNPQTANYLTQGAAMPNMDFALESCRQYLKNEFQEYYNLFRSGKGNGYPVQTDRLGWAHPYGDRSAGEVGGSDIYTYDGIATLACRSLDGYRFSKITNQMGQDRQPNFLYTKDGQAINHDNWLQNGPNGPWQPIVFYNRIFSGAEILGFADAPTYQVNYVKRNDLEPSYEDALFNYEPIDTEHYTRVARRPQALSWLGNDAVSKNVVNMLGSLARLSLTEYSCQSYDPENCWNGLSFYGRLNIQSEDGYYADLVSRDMGWAITAATAAYALSDNPSDRRGMYEWMKKSSDLFEGQQYPDNCNSFIVHGKSTDDGEQRVLYRGDVTATVYNTLQSLYKTAFEGGDPREGNRLKNYYRKWLYSMIDSFAWNEEGNGPYWGLPLGCWYTDTGNDGRSSNDIECPPDSPEQIWCRWEAIPESQQNWNNDIDNHHSHANFAWGYNLTNDRRFMEYAFKYYSNWSNAPTLEQRIQNLLSSNPGGESGYRFLESAGPTFAISQLLGL